MFRPWTVPIMTFSIYCEADVMRVTQNRMDSRILESIQNSQSELAKVSRQISSGKRIDRMSDDVTGTEELLQAEREKGNVGVYRENIQQAKGMLSMGASKLSNTSDRLTRAQELATQASTETYTESDLKGMAAEINGILEQVVSDANATYAGEHVFAGRNSDEAAYSVERDSEGEIVGVDYQGSSTTTRAPIASRRSADVNLVGDRYFRKNEDVFDSLLQLRDSMLDGDPDNIRAARQRVDEAHSGINVGNSEVGARINTLENVDESLQDLELKSEERISEVGDTDMAEASTEYRRNTAILQNLMKLASESTSNSLASIL